MTKKTLRNRPTRRKHAVPKLKKAATPDFPPSKPDPVGDRLVEAVADMQDYAILGRYHFKRDDVECSITRDHTAAYDAASEVAVIAEQMQETLNAAIQDARDAHEQATVLASYADRLCAIAARVMRHAGRLEGYEDSLASADQAFNQLKAHRSGALPAFTSWPKIEVQS